MTNSGLLDEGNAALAMNLAGTHPRLIWYAPQHSEGESDGAATISDLIPDQVTWIVLQLCAGGGAAGAVEGPPRRPAGRRTAAGRGAGVGDRRGPRPAVPIAARPRPRRRSVAHRRHCSGCCPASASATTPRRPPSCRPSPSAAALHPQAVAHTLFGPPPATDADLVNLARELDNIERQVAQS